MNQELNLFLRDCQRIDEAWPIWDNGRMPLQERTYLCSKLPPERYITSARAILFQRNDVMVITDFKGEPYIVPGGRREPGESVEMALHRELLEETGWRLRETAVLGIVHFRHLAPKPPGYKFPYPDFVQAIYVAQADTFHPDLIEPDPYVSESRFRPISEVQALPLSSNQLPLLTAAERA